MNADDAHSNNEPEVSPLYTSDRFVPARSGDESGNIYSVIDELRAQSTHSPEASRDDSKDAYTQLLRREMLGFRSPPRASTERTEDGRLLRSPDRARVLQCTIPTEEEENADPFVSSPVKFLSSSVSMMQGSRPAVRRIPRVPYKVLDAPQLNDDFYLNLIDWSSLNVLAVGLGNSVYLWNAVTSRVSKLCEMGEEDVVTSVGWSQRGSHLAIGTSRGEVQIWDPSAQKKLRTMTGHQGRIGSLAWNGYLLATGSRDHSILLHDVRIAEHYTEKLVGHRQEVCGLKWSPDETQLASGGNDNKLLIWNCASYKSPAMKFSDHTAAVKALAWSPHQSGLLASGGGTADRCIKFWNTLNGSLVNSIDTGSQVCNLNWSRNCNEIVSTHGYSLNQIIVWKYPSMTKVATLTGHTFRVLYLATSPDGQNIVTGAGDETLRFWQVFPSHGVKMSHPNSPTNHSSLLGSLSFSSTHTIR